MTQDVLQEFVVNTVRISLHLMLMFVPMFALLLNHGLGIRWKIQIVELVIATYVVLLKDQDLIIRVMQQSNL